MKETVYICRGCNERYTEDELNDLRGMREAFYLGDHGYLLCPDCYDNIRRKSLEEQRDILLNQ